MERAREVYKECSGIIPHKRFSFGKIWILVAEFEIRRKDIKAARRILGNAIGRAPKDKIFKRYIEMELQLGSIDRCRTINKKYIEWMPANCYAWIKFAELESSVGETEWARSIFELAALQRVLDLPKNCGRFEEHYDYTFPDNAAGPALKLLEAAYKWKKQKLNTSDD